jgi:hypothetical protein
MCHTGKSEIKTIAARSHECGKDFSTKFSHALTLHAGDIKLRLQCGHKRQTKNENRKLRKLPNPFARSVSVTLCTETLTALWGVKGMTRLRYHVTTVGLSTTQENNTVVNFHQVQSLQFAVLVQHRAFWSSDVTV